MLGQSDRNRLRWGMWLLSLPLLTSVTCQAGPVVLLGREVALAKRVPFGSISHSAWDALLQSHVTDAGRVRYAEWKDSAKAVQELDEYLGLLSTVNVEAPASREERLAFWINAYNAMTIRGILREYPTTSIRNHTAKLFGYNIWKDLRLQVGGEALSLDHIEHEILRKLEEPRIHFAIVCASVGCPRLLNRAYLPAELEAQLAENSRHFFADSAKFQWEAKANQVRVSPLLEWFATDFGADLPAQMRFIAPYVPEAARPALEGGKVTVRYLDYDWSLNDAQPAKE